MAVFVKLEIPSLTANKEIKNNYLVFEIRRQVLMLAVDGTPPEKWL